jgi:putative ABC transport system permease protein
VVLVLLLAAANVANLLLARATAREREIAVRSALGATRLRLLRQLLGESLLLSLMGGMLGILLAYGGVRLLLAWGPGSVPRADEIGIDARVLGFTLLISLLTGIIFGTAPAVRASRPNLNESLKEGGRGGTQGLQHRRILSLLVVSEIALALLLLIGAGLLVKSFYRIQQVDPGLNPQNVLTMEVGLPRNKYTNSQQQAAFFEKVLERVKGLPGAQHAALINDLPLASGGSSTIFVVEGRAAPVAGQEPRTHYRPVSSDYFVAMGIPLLKGRSVSERDNREAPPVVVISQSIAERYFPNADPIGKRIGIDSPPEWREIVGVVADVRHHGLDNEAKPHIYVPYLQNSADYLTLTSATMSLVVRTSGAAPLSLAESVRREVLSVDKDQPVAKVKSMEQVIDESVTQRRFNMLLLIILAGIALVLAAVGVYSVISYSVTRRTQEIGVRMALGAQPRDILRLVLRESIVMVMIGSVIGLAVGSVLMRVMSSLLFGVSPTDPLTFGLLTLVLLLVAVAACLIPARRATRVDPIIALRYD